MKSCLDCGEPSVFATCDYCVTWMLLMVLWGEEL